MLKIILEGSPLVSMINSAYSLARSGKDKRGIECYGLLFGKIENNNGSLISRINFAQPIQIAPRSYDAIWRCRKEECRTKRSTKILTNNHLLGDYHSHIDGETELSSTDKNDLRKTKNLYSLILSINKRKRLKNQNRIYVYPERKEIIFDIYEDYIIALGGYSYINGRIRRTELEIDKLNLSPLNKKIIKIS